MTCWREPARESATVGDPENMRDARLERTCAETEALAVLDLEAGGLDRDAGVARRVAASGDRGPESAAIRECQDRSHWLAPGNYVLVEAQLAARPYHAMELRER